MIPVSEVGHIAEAHGAPVWGAVGAADLPVDREEIERILPGARTVVVLGSPHSRSAIASTNIQVAQYDTNHAYDEAARASHAVALWLERKGYGAVAVPAFIPIDMSPPKHGMRGSVDGYSSGRFPDAGGCY